jgi:hypothetical protein
MEAPGIKRLGYLQQKLPLSLHKLRILEGPEILVCSVLYTFVPVEEVYPIPQNLRFKLSISWLLTRIYVSVLTSRYRTSAEVLSRAIPLLR